MVDITVTLSDIDEKDVNNIVHSCEILCDNVAIDITEPWPKLVFGDTFMFQNEEYAFLSYIKDGKVRCINTEALMSGAYLQVAYFDCTRTQPDMKFMKRKD